MLSVSFVTFVRATCTLRDYLHIYLRQIILIQLADYAFLDVP